MLEVRPAVSDLLEILDGRGRTASYFTDEEADRHSRTERWECNGRDGVNPRQG